MFRLLIASCWTLGQPQQRARWKRAISAVEGSVGELAGQVYAERYFPAANGALRSSAVCMFTNTPDEHFIIDRAPDASEVLLVSPCSGHGFKFCSVVGEICADLVQHGRTSHDIGLFRLARFADRLR